LEVTVPKFCSLTDGDFLKAGVFRRYHVLQDPVNFVDPAGLWTVAIGLGGTGGAGGGVSGSGMLVFDDNGNVGFVASGGAGGYGGVSASAGGIFQVTNADTIYDLKGVSVQTGGSVQITKKLSIGAELVTGKGYVGYNINVGLHYCPINL